MRIQAELDGKSRTKQVYNKIAQKMTEQGQKRDGEQCKTKIKKMYTLKTIITFQETTKKNMSFL